MLLMAQGGRNLSIHWPESAVVYFQYITDAVSRTFFEPRRESHNGISFRKLSGIGQLVTAGVTSVFMGPVAMCTAASGLKLYLHFSSDRI